MGRLLSLGFLSNTSNAIACTKFRSAGRSSSSNKKSSITIIGKSYAQDLLVKVLSLLQTGAPNELGQVRPSAGETDMEAILRRTVATVGASADGRRTVGLSESHNETQVSVLLQAARASRVCPPVECVGKELIRLCASHGGQ